MSRPNMSTIAVEVKCSVMTVSRALRGHPSVRPALRKKIQAAAAKLGYRPDPSLSALVAYRSRVARADGSNILAYVTTWDTREGWKKIEHYAQLFQGAQARARELGFTLENFWLREPSLRQKRAGDILYHRGIRALLIAPLQVNIGHLHMDWNKFSAVTVGHSLASPHMHYVATNYFQGIMLAWKKLRALGYRKIGLAINRRHDTRTLHRWVAAHELMQMRQPAKWRVPTLLIRREIEPAPVIAWLKRHRPDVVLGLGPGMSDWARRAGFKVPEEMSYVNLDLHHPDGSYAGLFQHPDRLGACAVDLVHWQIQRFETGIPKIAQGILVEPSWVPGATLKDS